jgi:hypothetical protein
MSTARAHKTVAKYVTGRVTSSRPGRRRKQDGDKFVAAVFWVGITLVLAFVLWSFAMVFLEALEQWRR